MLNLFFLVSDLGPQPERLWTLCVVNKTYIAGPVPPPDIIPGRESRTDVSFRTTNHTRSSFHVSNTSFSPMRGTAQRTLEQPAQWIIFPFSDLYFWGVRLLLFYEFLKKSWTSTIGRNSNFRVDFFQKVGLECSDRSSDPWLNTSLS